MSDYQVINAGAPEQWHDVVSPNGARGKQFVDAGLETQYVGVSLNANQPGEAAARWHSHSQLEEIYLFLAGEGQMALNDDVIDVHPGTIVRVGQGVWRAWRALPDSPGELRWLCIRGGGADLKSIGHDADFDHDRPLPWAA